MTINRLCRLQHKLIIYRNYHLNSERVADFPNTYPCRDDKYHWNEIWSKHHDSHSNRGVSVKMILPPPNVTGYLHLGHALTITIQDVLARWYKMQGSPVLWVPGLDHAGIATQVAVEKYLLATRNITRHELGREKFLHHVEKWKDEKGDKIRRQLQSLGASLDWSREYFTMSKHHNNAVIGAFITMYERNLLYRNNDLVNWCPALRSTISDIEVDSLEINARTNLEIPGYESKIPFGEIVDIAFRLKDSREKIVVSTTRVETMVGDVAIAVHPDDDRYSRHIGQLVWHPLRETYIPVIKDESVKKEFGTGVMKITPAHDRLDFEIARRHGLESINVIGEDGKMTENAKAFAGILRFYARRKILDQLSNLGALEGIRGHPMSIPICSRSGDVVEYVLKEQWFLRTQKMAEGAIEAVRKKKIKIEPLRYEDLWYCKLKNTKDWCISRQLWWGHSIPAYKCQIGDEIQWIAARNSAEAEEFFTKKYGSNAIDVKQDDDVLDTWFSAALLPLTAMGWPDEKYANDYPLDLMETGHDILFHWVARMIMLSTELVGEIPFKELLLHGIVCDAQGKKMSKSRGNLILPEFVIDGVSRHDLDSKAQESFKTGTFSKSEMKRTLAVNAKVFPEGIPECGVDALRFTLCAHNMKNDKISFNIIECKTNKSFCNKIWQACRFVLLATDKYFVQKPNHLNMVDRWILSRLTMMVDNVNTHFAQRNFHKAIVSFKKFFYYEFCDYFLETSKVGLAGADQNIIHSHRYTLVKCLEVSLRIIAPVIPHLSEQLYSRLGKKLSVFQQIPSIMEASYPTMNEVTYRDVELEDKFDEILELVSNARNFLNNINKKSILEVHVVADKNEDMQFYIDNINFLVASTRIKTVKVFSSNEYVMSEDSLCITGANYRIYCVLTDHDVAVCLRERIRNESLRMKQKSDGMMRKNSEL